MGFNDCDQMTDAQRRRSRWICEPGNHRVEIVDWNHSHGRNGRSVQFVVQDESGRELYVEFPVSVGALRAGQLLSFVVAAKNWVPVECQGQELVVNNAKTFNSLVGKFLLVNVIRNTRGLHQVVAWAAAPSTS